MNIKVSIIVPVYNTENHLTKCLDSLVNQSLKEIEIILINDCSTDGSLAILQEYKEQYSEKIIIIDLKKNKGPGGARNEGINIAKGEYLGFVDSDDDASLEMFEKLYNIAHEGNYDMADCEFYYEAFKQNMKTTNENALDDLDLEKRKELFIHSGFIWSKIIKRSILIDNNIRFRENAAYEDIDFMRIILFYCKKIYAIDDVLYNHRNNLNSITNIPTETIQVHQKMDSMKSLVKKFKELNAFEDYKEEIAYLVYKTYMISLEYIMGLERNDVNFELFKELRNLFFELVDYDYTKNKYILQIDKDSRLLPEMNNKDYKETISFYNYICKL